MNLLTVLTILQLGSTNLFLNTDPTTPGTNSVAFLTIHQESNDYKIYREGYEAVMSESWSGAITQFEYLAKKYPDSRWMPNASYWKCYALEQQETDRSNKMECYSDVATKYPQSRWSYEAGIRLMQMARSESEKAAILQKHDIHEESLRISVLRALRQREDFDNWQFLPTMYRNTESRQIRTEIVVLLSTISDKAVADSLYQLAKFESNAGILSITLNAVVEIHKRSQRNRNSDEFILSEDQLADYLRNLYSYHKDPELRGMVVKAISQTSTAGLTDILITASEQNQPYARYALYGLSQSRSAGRDQLLYISVDTTRHSTLRVEALGFLQQMNDKSEEIFQNMRYLAFNDPDLKVSRQALLVFLPHVNLNEAMSLFTEMEKFDHRQVIISYLPRLSGGVEYLTPEIIDNLMQQTEDYRLHIQLIRMMHRQRQPETVRFLEKIAREHPDQQVRQEAIGVIGSIDHSEATRALEDLITN